MGGPPASAPLLLAAAVLASSAAAPALPAGGVQLSSMFAWSGKPGLGQIGEDTLLAISGGIGEAWRCYAGALIKKSTVRLCVSPCSSAASHPRPLCIRMGG